MRILDFADGFESSVEPTALHLSASEVDVTPTGNLSSTDVQSALVELQSDIDAQVDAPASTDNAVPRFDGTTGQIQNSAIIIDDSNNISGIKSLSTDGTSQNIGTSNTGTAINIGTGSGLNTIHIGGANSTVILTGDVLSEDVTNLTVRDKLITVNKGGAAASGGVTGLEIEENTSITGYAKTSADRNSWEIKAPNQTGVVSVSPSSSNDEVALLAKTQTLSNKTLSAPTVDVLVMDDQASAPANPSSGFYKMYVKTDGKAYILDSSGNESKLGSGGGGSKNYLTQYQASLGSGATNTGNGDLETGNTTGFSLGTVTLTNNKPSGVPTFGNGASGNLSLSAISSGQIAQKYSLGYTSSAATTAGNFVASDAFFIDKEDQAKKLSISFAYLAQTNPSNANWSGTTSNSFAVAIYDVTNSSWIIPDTPFNLKQSSGIGTYTGTFQTSSNGTSYRLVVYNANATSGAVTVYFDDFIVGPASFSIYNSPVAASYWVSANFAASSTVPVNYDSKEFDTASAVTTSATAWKFTAPVSGTYAVQGVGALVSGTPYIVLYKNGSAYKMIGSFNGSPSGAIATTIQLNAGDFIDIRPQNTQTVLGGTLNSTSGTTNISIYLLQSSSAVGPAGQVVAASYYVSANFAAGTATPINFDSKIYDTTSSVTPSSSAWKFTAPISGIYSIGGFWNVTSGIVGTWMLYKNGSVFQTLSHANTTVSWANPNNQISLNAGDTIDIRPSTGATIIGGSLATAETGYVTIALIQGASAQVSSNATVAASYWVSANFACSSTTPINFDSKEFDTAASVTTSATAWKFTAPVSGLYSVEVYAVATSAGAAQLFIYKNGSNYKNLCAENTNTAIMSGATKIMLNAGDFIDIRSGGTPTITGGTLTNGLAGTIAITKVG